MVLTNENDGRLIFSSNLEQHPDKLLPFSMPFACQCGSRNVEEGGFGFVCKGLCQHGLPIPRRAVQKQPSCRSPEALKEVCTLRRQNHHLLQYLQVTVCAQSTVESMSETEAVPAVYGVSCMTQERCVSLDDCRECA